MLFKDSQILHIASSKGATLFSELLLLAEFTHFPGLHEEVSRRDRHHLENHGFPSLTLFCYHPLATNKTWAVHELLQTKKMQAS